ncbi:MAG: cupin domain-containing protein [Sediminibacterium sp.]|nr:cupin domain-containing protein [Sediminibacterium sp.]
MKLKLLAGFLIINFSAYTQSIQSGVYSIPPSTSTTGESKGVGLLYGSGQILDKQSVAYHSIKAGKRIKFIAGDNEEDLIIIKSGQANATLFGEEKILEAGSLIFVLPKDKVIIKNNGVNPLDYYILTATSKKALTKEKGTDIGKSCMFAWNDFVFKPHDKGGVRQVFNRTTAMLTKFDIHITTLNVGMKSHDPHTHKNEEIILLLAGNAQMQIDQAHPKANEGDIVWLGSMVSHNLTNIGSIPCLYYAIQWN